jgi:hypothetical protein
LLGSDKHSRPHSPKTIGHFRSFHGYLSKNLLLHDILKHYNNKKTKKKHMVWGGILSFFFVLHFWIKQYTNFLNLINLTKFVSHHLIATQAIFTATNFSPQIIFWDGLFWVIWRWPRSPGNTDRPIKSAVARSRQGFTCKSGKKQKEASIEKKTLLHFSLCLVMFCIDFRQIANLIQKNLLASLNHLEINPKISVKQTASF